MVRRNERGQATLEYILLLAVIVSFFLLIRKGLNEFKLSRGQSLSTALTANMTGDFRYAYQYGHPEARGYGDKGGPKKHPRIQDENELSNFRIFINPVVR